MAVLRDSYFVEKEAFTLMAGNLTDLEVLEIGCGDGRLTWKYASNTKHVIGIDPNQEKIDRARLNLPEDLQSKVDFLAMDLEEFKMRQTELRTPAQFDLVILSWAL